VKIGVVSDTHCRAVRELSPRILDGLSSMDLLVHAGDYDEVSLLDELRALGIPFHGVYGNMDGPEVRRLVPSSEVFEVEGFRIGITHPPDGGPPFGIERRVKKKLPEVDVIIFGHTHFVKNRLKGKVLYLNPGTATGAFPARHKTFAILTLDPRPRAVIHRL